jgi:nucleoside-diphosphate-sugar epimerase
VTGRTLVTGVAGFIGSHVAERLIDDGREVVGVDSFTDYYARELKDKNLAELQGREGFRMIEADLATTDLGPLFDDVTSVCHLAAQAGVRASWGEHFSTYIDCNIRATQRLLEFVKARPVEKFVYASSSSVYGQTDELPMRETSRTCPVSPYGVTKLAGEHLAVLYHRNYRVPTVSLRFFTVYGPRQRPDMAFNRFIHAGLRGEPVSIYGNGEQTRDFTYIDDIVAGVVRSLDAGPAGEVLNLGGGSRVTLNHALAVIEEAIGRPIERRYEEKALGDVTDTLADNLKARELIGFAPVVRIEEGIPREYEWITSLAG